MRKEQSALLGLSLRTHDEEKRKIAHGLHDSAGQYLVALQMKLDGLQRSLYCCNTGRANPVVDECRELIKRCCREIRATSHLLYPPLLDDLGLEAAVHLHVDRFMERTKVKVELDIEPNLGPPRSRFGDRSFSRRSRSVGKLSTGNRLARMCKSRSAPCPTSVFVEVAGAGGGVELPDQFMASSGP